ncbi:MAG TPA: toll/interleukin-1 receptor domain-containing protein, partial [Puia sp.]
MPSPGEEIFLSYSDDDKDWVLGYLMPLLRDQGWPVRTPEQFPPGGSKLDQLEKAIAAARYTLLVFSPAYLDDTYTSFLEQLASFYTVRERQYGLIPVMYKKCALPLRISFRVMLDFSDPALWDQERQRLLDFLGAGTVAQKDELPCPYPGMRPFALEQAGDFFGRDAEIDQVLRVIRNQRFLCILGASGSGKSSLVFAGVLPRLARSGLFEKDFWLVRDLRPGTTPLQKIRQVMGSDCADMATSISDLLALHPPAKKLLLIIDQFEEVFGDVDPEESKSFLGIVEALRQLDNCCVIITMRAAFYQDLMSCPLWPVSIAERLELVPLRGKALAEAIERPALQAGVHLESGLLDLILHDAANEPGVLPLVQEVMILLWDKRVGKLITKSAYWSLGKSGLAVALAAKADATYLILSADRQRIAKRIFLRLIQFGEGRPDTRRQQSSDGLYSLEDDKADFSYCLLHLVNNRLLTLSGEEGDKAVDVDIAHESLIEGWPLLHTWISERRESELARRRLQQKAEEWVRL